MRDNTPATQPRISTKRGARPIFIVDKKAWDTNEGGKYQPLVVPVSQLCKELLFHLLINPKTKAAKPLLITLVQTISEMLGEGATQLIGNLDHLSGKIQDSRVRSAVDEISEKYNSSLSMEEIARSSGMSTRNFNRLFLSEVGMTPKQVMTYYRIKSAQKLLIKGMSVTDVSLDVGYQSLSQFISTYRKLTSHLPSEEIGEFQ